MVLRLRFRTPEEEEEFTAVGVEACDGGATGCGGTDGGVVTMKLPPDEGEMLIDCWGEGSSEVPSSEKISEAMVVIKGSSIVSLRRV